MDAFSQSARYFPTPLQQVVYFDTYSRWSYELGRRETWVETVDRAHTHLRELSRNQLDPVDYEFLRQQMLQMRAMPSMRLLSMAGDAALREPVSIYNCSALPISDLRAFGEVMYLSMHGVGVGYSVERQFVRQLPLVQFKGGDFTHRGTHYVEDSTEGWVHALNLGIETWFAGDDISFNFDFVRPAGAILRTKGGRASGPEPLKRALALIRSIILGASARQLRPFEAHRIVCLIAEASISGGMRRSALLALFDLDDREILSCKAGYGWWDAYPELAYSNNSAVIGASTSEYQIETLLRQMDANGTGEPGLFNRDGVDALRPERRQSAVWLTNPCGEVALRPYQTCNLSSAVVRAEDDYTAMVQKVRAATIIGTIQSMADDFGPVLRDEWRSNQREERILGVDLNGQMDSTLVQQPWVLSGLSEVAVQTNARYARILGINQAAAVTSVKPSGNSSQMLDSASGLHARWSEYYIRRKRFNRHSPVRRLLEAQGVPMSPENGQTEETATTFVVEFPVKAPEGAVTRNERTAIEQLDYWLRVRTEYTEHQPSVTITYQPEELEAIVSWVKEHKDYVAGLSFLPASDHTYAQAPYEEITAEEFARRAEGFPTLDFSRLPEFEAEDYTTAAQELACVGGQCDIQL